MTVADFVNLLRKSPRFKFHAQRSVRSSKQRSVVLAFVALLVTCSHPCAHLYAQGAGTGTIEGTVVDTSGAVVPGAIVTATNTATNLKSSQSTSGSGSYTLSALPPGDYAVEVQAKGFESSRQQVTLNALTQLGVNIRLLAGSTEQVQVTAAAPELETENGQVSITIPNSTYEALPVEMNNAPKSAIGFLSLVPGITENNNFGAPVINGGVIASSQIYLNGLLSSATHRCCSSLVSGKARTPKSLLQPRSESSRAAAAAETPLMLPLLTRASVRRRKPA